MNCGLGRVMLVTIVCLTSACTREPRLPTYPHLDAEEALGIVARRSRSLTSLSASCRLRLEESSGTAILLDGVLVSRPPSQMRIRTWKAGQLVFDLLADEGELWLLSTQLDDDNGANLSQALDPEGIVESLSLVTGSFIDGARISSLSDEFIIAERPDGNSSMLLRALIDRNTLTLRQCTLVDERGVERYRLTLDRHVVIDEHPMPSRIIGFGEAGRFTLRLSDIEVNQPLAGSAFHRPPAAVRLMR